MTSHCLKALLEMSNFTIFTLSAVICLFCMVGKLTNALPAVGKSAFVLRRFQKGFFSDELCGANRWGGDVKIYVIFYFIFI